MRQLFSCILLLLLLATARSAQASHIYGADFFYEHISGSAYKVSLVIYGDCSGSAFPSLDTAKPVVNVYEQGLWQQTLSLQLESPGVEVTPVCPADVGKTACKLPGSTIAGVKRYIYSATMIMPYLSTSWVFRFEGTMSDNTLAGRSNNITNIAVSGTVGSVMSLEALLSNKTPTGGLDSNSSPRFTTIPTPFYCVNIPQQYNQGAVDADFDSLVYALAPGLEDPGTVTYNPGYSATTPVHTAAGTFSYNTATGQMSFTPDQLQKSLVVNEVKEYRNGRLIGSASREMTFIIVNCTSTPAFSIMDTSAAANTVGGVAEASSFHVCQGTDRIRFQVVPRTPGLDTIMATINGLPTGATATIFNNNTPAPVINIQWNTANVPVGSYNFFVTYKDNDCPLASLQTQAYTIYFVKRPVSGFTGPDELCQGDTASFLFTGTVGNSPNIKYNWNWDNPGYTTGAQGGPWQVHWFSDGLKTVKLQVVENGCPSETVSRTVLVKPAPYAGFTAPLEVCQFDTLRLIHFRDFSRSLEDLTFAWNFDGADTPFASGPGPYIRRWDKPGIKHVTLNMDYLGCPGKRSLDITVRPVPLARINNAPEKVCMGDKIFLSASGGESYVWKPADSLQFGPDGKMYAQILKPTVYRVLVISEYGCIDSAAISYSDVEPCCNFAYPNAFTPNGDGRNDRFRVITYGNHLEYELSIYNNWGQRVYYGLDAKEGWDGLFNGKPCDAGTYFYYLNARCFTNRQEIHKGSLMLIK